jgi:glycosyltransferase involved in cell wall biosynthesis
MPKVLRIINRFNLGGPTFNAAYLTRYLSPEFETLLVGGQKDESEAGSEFIVEGLGIKPLVLPEMRRSIGIMNDYKSYQKLREIIGDFKPDVVHTHASKAGFVGRMAASKMKVPVIVHTFHGNVFKGYFSPWKTNVYKKLERHLASKSTAIIAISELQKQELVQEHRICRAEKIEVIPLGFDLTRFHENQKELRQKFRTEYQLDDQTIAIGIVGRLVPIKDHAMFLHAFAAVKKRTSIPIRAFIVGDGELRNELESLCQTLDLSYATSGKCDVVFTSWIKDVESVNAGMDIIALSSLNEGTPVSLIEAQASQKPIITTEVGGIRNIVIPGETALLSPKSDVNAFAHHMEKLVNNEDLRQQMSLKGWDFVENRFHYTRLVSDMKSLYSRLLENVVRA